MRVGGDAAVRRRTCSPRPTRRRTPARAPALRRTSPSRSVRSCNLPARHIEPAFDPEYRAAGPPRANWSPRSFHRACSVLERSCAARGCWGHVITRHHLRHRHAHDFPARSALHWNGAVPRPHAARPHRRVRSARAHARHASAPRGVHAPPGAERVGADHLCRTPRSPTRRRSTSSACRADGASTSTSTTRSCSASCARAGSTLATSPRCAAALSSSAPPDCSAATARPRTGSRSICSRSWEPRRSGSASCVIGNRITGGGRDGGDRLRPRRSPLSSSGQPRRSGSSSRSSTRPRRRSTAGRRTRPRTTSVDALRRDSRDALDRRRALVEAAARRLG